MSLNELNDVGNFRSAPYDGVVKATAVNFKRYCSSQPSMVHWLSSSIFPCLVGCRPAMVTSDQISLLLAPDLPNPYIF